MSYLDEAFKDLHELEDGVDLQDEQEVKDAIAFMNGDKDNLAQLELIVDADADSEEDIKDTYVGELLLYCPVCHTIHYEKEENIVFDEENDEIVNIGDACPHCKQENGYEIVGKVEEYDATEEEPDKEDKEPTEDEDVPLELDDIEDFEDEETTKKVEESFKIRKRLKEHFEEDNLEELARFTGERLHTRERVRETKKVEPKKVEPKKSLKESKTPKKALKESDEQIYIYQLPIDANVNYIRQNIGLTSANSIKLVGKVNKKGDQPGDILISGTKEDLAKFVDDYFDLQLLDDYLYEEDEFDTDLITPLKMKESKLVEKPVYGLEPRYDSRKSFYGKAQVDTGDKGDKNKLYSYDTLVAEIKNGKPVVYGTYSQTTLRHIKEWLKQLGFKAENSKQILADYGAKKESCKEAKETKLTKEAQFLKGAYEDLKDNPTGTHYYDLGLDSGLHLVVGEYEDEICVKVAYNCDDLQCDYDYDWEMPLYKNGECAFVEDALDENTDWNKEAQYLVKEAKAMDEEVAKGELVCESCGKGKKRTKQKVKEGYYDYMDKDYAHILDSNVDVYDVNAYILKDSNNKFKAHYTDEYAIIVAPNGKGCVVDYEAVGQDFDSVDSKIDFGAVENKDGEYTDEKGNKYKTFSIIATHRLTTTPKEIMENAPKKTMKYKDFFNKYKYNDRCASNFRELVSYLQSNGAFKGEKVTESKKKELDESLIVTCDFDEYKPWSGAIDTYARIEEEGKLDDLENLLEDCYPEGISMVGINDILWFDSDWVLEELGINENDEEETEDEEDFDESLFESLVDRYCQRVYDNVRDFKTTSCYKKEKNFVVEGILHYTNGKKAKTTFTFKEAKAPNGKRKFVGLNETFSKDNKAFTLLVSTGDKKLLSESLSYKYNVEYKGEQKEIKGKIVTPKH